MPIFFILGIGTLLVEVVDMFLGAPRAAGLSLILWVLGVLPAGFGMDWDRRVQMSACYIAMIASACVAVAGAVIRF